MIFDGPEKIIVHNDSHTPGRQTVDITHELSHDLLDHVPTLALDERGCRYWDRVMEKEAEWLAGVLLVPEEAAFLIVRRGWELRDAATRFGVSERLIDWRLNKTGARLRARRTAEALTR
jgi:Zn-dependent peptidase ImmA (M78 family)